MSIPEVVKNRYDLLLEWAEAGGLVLMQCERDGQPVYIICLQGSAPDGDVTLVPVAQMLSDADIDEITPPA